MASKKDNNAELQKRGVFLTQGRGGIMLKLKKIASVRCGNSILWLDSNLDVLPQKEEIKRRYHELVRPGHDKQLRPRRQNKSEFFEC